MKTFKEMMAKAITENVAGAQIDNVAGVKHSITADVNPGNTLKSGVTNHYTPIENIVTNVRNLFGVHLGVVAAVAEDGCSLKLHSSKFVSKEQIDAVLNNMIYNDRLSLRSYVMQQGLDQIRMECVGQYWIVYFYASDLKQANKGAEVCPMCHCTPCTCGDFSKMASESETIDIDVELVNESEEEMEEMVRKELHEIIDSEDKIKAAHAIADKIANEIEMLKDVYMAAVKDADGNESIALRMNCPERRPFGKTETVKRTLLNIFNSGENGIWVPNWDKPHMIDDEVKELIEKILAYIGAKETTDPCCWQICDGDNLKANTEPVEDDDTEEECDDETEKDDDSEECEGEKVKESSDENVVYSIVDADGIEAAVAQTEEEADVLLKKFNKAGKFSIKKQPAKDYIKE